MKWHLPSRVLRLDGFLLYFGIAHSPESICGGVQVEVTQIISSPFVWYIESLCMHLYRTSELMHYDLINGAMRVSVTYIILYLIEYS